MMILAKIRDIQNIKSPSS